MKSLIHKFLTDSDGASVLSIIAATLVIAIVAGIGIFEYARADHFTPSLLNTLMLSAIIVTQGIWNICYAVHALVLNRENKALKRALEERRE